MSRFVQSLIIAAAVICPAPGFAQAQDRAAVSVRSNDLNLSNARDARLMLRRLERAVDQVCGRSIAATYASERDEYLSCRAATLADSVNRLSSQEVSAQYAERYGAHEVRVAGD
jgi:UrcA family protein